MPYNVLIFRTDQNVMVSTKGQRYFVLLTRGPKSGKADMFTFLELPGKEVVQPKTDFEGGALNFMEQHV